MLHTFDGMQLEYHGTCSLCVEANGQHTKANFFIVNGSKSLIGLPLIEKLQLLEVNCKTVHNIVVSDEHFTPDTQHLKDEAKALLEEITASYSKVFNGQGCIAGEFKIHLKEDAIPKQAPPRKVPLSVCDDFKQHLDKLVQDDIMAKLDANEPSPWTSSFVVVKKPKGIWVCIDPQSLNAAMLRPIHRTQYLSDVLPQVAGAKYFSKLDIKWGFWNLKLDKESSYLTTMNTLFGHYRWKRLPFGLKCWK